MSAIYVLGSYDIVDHKGYEGYVPGVLPLLEKHGAEVLVADFDAQPLEGGRRGVYCVLRFASEEAARRWYEDPAYQPIKRLRVGNSANGSMMLVKGFEPPVSGRGVSSPRQAQAPGTTRAR